MKKFAKQLEKFNVFRLHSTLNEEDREDESEERSVLLVWLATKHIAPFDVVTHLLTSEDQDKQHLIANVKQQLIDASVQIHATLRKHSKTFADMYKVAISTQQCVQKSIKANRKWISGYGIYSPAWGVPCSRVPLSLAKPEGHMNLTPKAYLVSILISGINVHTQVPVGDMKTCVQIDGHALIQTLGKPHGCQTLSDYADVFIRNVTHQFGEHITRVDVVFKRYIAEESIKTATRSERVGTRKPIHKTVDGTDILLAQV